MTLIQKPNPGDACLVCKTGKLQARSRAQSATNREVVGGPIFPARPHLTELVCGKCGIKYEPQHVGQDINEFLEEALLGFRNPETKPTCCPNCDTYHLVQGRTKTPLDAFPIRKDFSGRHTEKEIDSHHYFLYCRHCLKILWDEPIVDRSRSTAGESAQLTESIGIRPHSSRGPATPIPPAKKPVRRTLDGRPPKPKH